MSFTHTVLPFGRWEKHVFEHAATGLAMELVPEEGACLLDLRFNHHSVLDGYRTPEEMDINRWAKSNFLLPFPNRLNEGSYEWEGQIYQFEINDSLTNNALHGFGNQLPFVPGYVELREKFCIVTCTHDNDGSHPGYPFPFRFEVQFKLHTEQGFQVHMRMTNTGQQTIPAGFGWHPYFTLGQSIDQYRLSLPACELVGIDGRMIPTGKTYDYEEFAEEKLIGITVLDNCFVFRKGPISWSVSGEIGTLVFRQDSGHGKFNYLQLFTPPDRKSLAIEPMSCNIDAFNNREGLLLLFPRQTASAGFALTYLPPE